MTALEEDKRRFKIFLAVNSLMVVLALGGMFAEFFLHLLWLRPVWIGALIVGFSVQLWLVLGLRKSVREREK
jgi:hypothetical protein